MQTPFVIRLNGAIQIAVKMFVQLGNRVVEFLEFTVALRVRRTSKHVLATRAVNAAVKHVLQVPLVVRVAKLASVIGKQLPGSPEYGPPVGVPLFKFKLSIVTVAPALSFNVQ